MNKINEFDIDLNEFKEGKRKNFKERIWFIKYWANFIRTHSDREWSKQQKVLIDSQFGKTKS